jgi:hypothetical protein
MSKSLRETLVDRYGEDILSHPVFGDGQHFHELAHQVEQREHMFGEQAFGPESEQTFAREVAGSERAGQFIIDGGGKQSPIKKA